jgi:hypothetical protein
VSIECQDWTATINTGPPGGSALLVVTGRCTLPTPGYHCELRRHDPQGVEPSNLLLELIVVEPSGVQPMVRTDYPLRFEIKPVSGYKTVSVLHHPIIYLEKDINIE